MSVISVKVLSVHTIDSTPSIVITTETCRIIFDVGEGNQRLCIEHKIRLGKISLMLITNSNVNTMGGLPGLCLTLHEAGNNQFHFHGPQSVYKYMSSLKWVMRNFCKDHWLENTSGLQINTNLSSQDLLSNESKQKEETKTTSQIHNGMPSAPDMIVCQMIDLIIYKIIPDNDSTHFSYLCSTIPKKGKFDVQKATALGVLKGPDYGKLKNGQTITLANGVKVHPDQVLEPEELSRHFLIICSFDETEMEFIQSLSKHSHITRFYDQSHEANQLDCVFHLSPHATFNHPVYSEWMDNFSPQTLQITLGHQTNQSITSFHSSTCYNNKLHQIAPNLFTKMTMQYPQPHGFTPIRTNIIPGYPLLEVIISPSRRRGLVPNPFVQSLDDEMIVNVQQFWSDLNNSNANDDVTNQPTFSQLCHAIPSPSTLNSTVSTSRVVFLGTGCAMPSMNRNVSGILLDINNHQSILMDCGEGTWNQLLKLNYFENLDKSSSSVDYLQYCKELLIDRIHLIWISHLHADHHLGMIRIIKERSSLVGRTADRRKPLLIIAPSAVLNFLYEYCRWVEPALLSHYVAVPSTHFVPLDAMDTEPRVERSSGGKIVGVKRNYEQQRNRTGKHLKNPIGPVGNGSLVKMDFANLGEECVMIEPINVVDVEKVRQALKDIEIESLQNIPVVHCNQSYGLVLDIIIDGQVNGSNKFRIVYSGDCRPSDELIKFGYQSDLLIHEATFADEEINEAMMKRHSTVGEAMEVCQKMNAKHLIISHFSQRYSGVVAIPSEGEGLLKDERVPIVAFDFMKINLLDLDGIHKYTKLFLLAFPSRCDDDNEEGDGS